MVIIFFKDVIKNNKLISFDSLFEKKKFAMKKSNVPSKQSCRQLLKIKPKTLKVFF